MPVKVHETCKSLHDSDVQQVNQSKATIVCVTVLIKCKQAKHCRAVWLQKVTLNKQTCKTAVA